MKYIIAAGLALCLAPSVFSSAIPVDMSPALDKRVVPLTPPQGSVVCLGYTVAESDILLAVNQGTAWATTSPPTQMGKTIQIYSVAIILTSHFSPGSANYPHIFNNYEAISFPNCAGMTIWEYPVLRYGTNPWVPAGKNTKLPTGPNGAKEPDRVIFAPTSSTSVTYCGTVTHDPNKLTNTGKTGAFVPCT